jgi:hypothetical protein
MRIRAYIPLAAIIILQAAHSANASTPVVAGTKCPKANLQASYKGKVFTCIKLGKYFYWDNGKSKVVSTPTLTPTPSPLPSLMPTPTPTFSPTPTPTFSPHPNQLAPLQVKNLHAQYLRNSENCFTGQVQVTFDFDLTGPLNVSFAYIQLGLSIGGTTYELITPNVPYDLAYFNTDPIHQSITLSIPDLSSTGIYKTYAFDHVEVATYSYDNFTKEFVKAAFDNLYGSCLPSPKTTQP